MKDSFSGVAHSGQNANDFMQATVKSRCRFHFQTEAQCSRSIPSEKTGRVFK
ncbi:MAG TPA: hypothetical protein DEB17_02230 [Chlorobaculum sp.]|uniref:Uncharacterized protein n=1 Tax=Chlorobaculum tepidum (strain ATCC 49652 / DSM 12025 / NBRC 103806 / TLS) TaxID=194439 RepID=Q8KEM6_CHLTE|nr:hypothetical protein CT0661 [Chlorobaculum tepidum TLS]HBU22814.1 hypothetical protein [Chlorobaculum sp.]